MGYIREMNVRAGDAVRAGQLIAVIDARDLEVGSQQAAAALDEARNGIAEADNGVAAAKAQLDFAQVTFRRMEGLFQKRSISNHEYDDTRARLNVAQAGYEMARAKRAQLDARIRQAEEGVRAAEVTRSFALIRAPFAGIVTEKHAEQGDMATPGAPLVTLEQSGGYQLDVPVEEARLGAIRVGIGVSVRLDAFDQTIAAKVGEIVPAIDAGSRTFTARVHLPPDHRLRSGLFGRARFPLSSERIVTVPVSAVAQRGQLHAVYVIDGDTARARLVTVGRRNDGLFEVLTGLNAGERVASPIPGELSDGVKVRAQS
jgi:RND family efflux transporter MFP subunit